jgi:peptidoglycan L-alanyl-D-glutamate endopeptidase CwlK
MRDQITLNRIKLLHPSLIDEVSEIYDEICKALGKGVLCRFAHTLRTNKEQDILFAKKPKVTNAKGGQSYHNYGLAIDIVLLLDKDNNGTHESASWNTKLDFDKDSQRDWMEVVRIFKMYGWEWGGDWKFVDAPHFQKTFGLSIKQLQQLTNNKGGTNYKIK